MILNTKFKNILLILCILFVLVIPSLLIFKNENYPDFDNYYTQAKVDSIIAKTKIGLFEDINLRLGKSYYSLPIFPLSIAIFSIISGIGSNYSINILHLLTILSIIMFSIMISIKIFNRKTGYFLIPLLFFLTPCINRRIIAPFRENLNILLILFLIYIIILFKDEYISKKSLGIISFFLIPSMILLYPLIPIIFILIISLFLFNKIRINKNFLSILLVIIIILSILFYMIRNFLINYIFYYISLTSGISLASLDVFIYNYGYINILLFGLLIIHFFKIIKGNYGSIIEKKFLFIIIILNLIPFLNNPLSNRIFLYSSIMIMISSPIILNKKVFNKTTLILIIFLIVISPAKFNFDNYNYNLITSDEKNACYWASKNTEENSIFLTQRGEEYLILPFCKRSTYGYDIFLSENFTLKNVDKKIIEFSRILNQEYGNRPHYFFLSKEKLNNTSYKESYLYGLNISIIEENKDYKKVFENKDVIIFKLQ
jgi:hypothetical protein